VNYFEYFDPHTKEAMVGALRTAYDRNMLADDPEIGHTSVSYGVSTWQSSLHYLERAFGAVAGAEVHRAGSAFHVKLPTCRLSFYKFGTSRRHKIEDFWLAGSLKRRTIIENNQCPSSAT
jgi:hypothetical protein